VVVIVCKLSVNLYASYSFVLFGNKKVSR